MLKPTLIAAAFLTLFLAAPAEGAKPEREGAAGASQFIRVGADRQVVEHVRQPGEIAASFKVASGAVPEGAQVVFEVHAIRGAERVLRWRCVAVEDLAECFVEPLLIAFAAADQALRLEVQLAAPVPGEFGPLQLALAQ